MDTPATAPVPPPTDGARVTRALHWLATLPVRGILWMAGEVVRAHPDVRRAAER